jgi:SAM-dependent MidA family methyltransferase
MFFYFYSVYNSISNTAKLIMEHEMGELFKVLALGAGDAWEPVGFARGDRSHRL